MRFHWKKLRKDKELEDEANSRTEEDNRTSNEKVDKDVNGTETDIENIKLKHSEITANDEESHHPLDTNS